MRRLSPYAVFLALITLPYLLGILIYTKRINVKKAQAVDPSGYSFQRKTWWDGTRYWRSYNDTSNSRIRFDYSTDGSSWTEDTSAQIGVNTSDFSVYGDSSNAYIAYPTSSVTNEDNLLQSSNLKAYWKMNESSWNGTSGEVLDASGNSLNGTRAGNATTTTSGKFNNAGTFDGFDSHFNVPDPGTNSALDFANGSTISISAWIYITNMPGGNTWQTIATKGGIDDTDDINYIFQIGNLSGTDVVTFCFTNSGSYNCWNGSGMDLVVNTWQQIGAKFTYGTASSIRTYHNGTEYSSGSWGSGTGSGAPDVTNKDLWIGADDYSDGNVSPQEEFNGRIDDLRIYDTGLSAAQMAVLAQPGYDIEVRKASSYPGTGFTWSNPTVSLNGSSSTNYYAYPSLASDSNSKLWNLATSISGSNSTTYTTRSTSASNVTAWDTSTSLDTSTNSNRYGVIVPRTSGAAYAIWIDGTAIEGKNYSGSSWDGSPTSIDTGTTGLTTTISALADSSGNIHLAYINNSNSAQYRKFTSSWQTAVTLDSNSGNTYPTISINTSNSDLYVFWIRSSHIYYKKGVSDYTSGNWDSLATDWKTTGTNTYVTSNYSESNRIFAMWYNGTSTTWDAVLNGITISINLTSDGSIAYGNMPVSSSKTSLTLSDTQTVQNDGSVAEDLTIKTSNATGGTTWTLGGSVGADIYKHEFSTNGGSGWTAFTTADTYQALVTNLGVSASQNIDFRLNTPTSTSDFNQKSITVTVLATQH